LVPCGKSRPRKKISGAKEQTNKAADALKRPQKNICEHRQKLRDIITLLITLYRFQTLENPDTRINTTLADGGGFEPLMLTYVKAINCLYYTVYIQVLFKYCPNFLPPHYQSKKVFALRQNPQISAGWSCFLSISYFPIAVLLRRKKSIPCFFGSEYFPHHISKTTKDFFVLKN